MAPYRSFRNDTPGTVPVKGALVRVRQRPHKGGALNAGEISEAAMDNGLHARHRAGAWTQSM